MKVEVTGKSERRSGTSAKTGKPYDGMTIYGLVKAVGVEGLKTEEVYLNYLSGMEIPEIKIGDIVDVEYTKAGFINAVSVVKKS